MTWQKNGTPETKTSSGDTSIDITDLTTFTFNVFLEHAFFATSGVLQAVRFDNDSGSVYAVRNSRNGGSDSTGGSLTLINDDVTSLTQQNDQFHVYCSLNISGEETLMMSWGVGRNATGAGNIPDRVEAVGKDAGTTQFTQFNKVRQAGTGTWDIDSNLSALSTN